MDNIKIDFEEIGWEGYEWIHVTQYKNVRRAVVNMVIKLEYIKCEELLQ
jgi:hypothetical protein